MISDPWDDGEVRVTFHHNGDFSGDVDISVPPERVDLVDDAGPVTFYSVRLPMQALRFIVDLHAYRQRVTHLEDLDLEAGTARVVPALPPITPHVRGYLATAAAEARVHGADAETQAILDDLARLGIS